MPTSLTSGSTLSALQRKVARLREALSGSGVFFAAARQSDPLPTLRDLASDWLFAEDLEIVVPAGTAPLQCTDPNHICGPITIGRRVIGRIDARRTKAFDEDDQLLIRALGQIVGAVLEQSSAQSQLDQYSAQVQANRDTLDQLLTFGRLVVSATADPQQLALQLATQVPSMVGGERASLLIIPLDNPDEPSLVLSTGTISSTERAREVRDHGLAGLVLRSREPMIIDETDTDRRWLTLKLRENEAPTRCAMAAPLIWGDRLLGALTVTTTETHLFDTPQLNLLELVACHISLALYAATLEQRLEGLTARMAEANRQIERALATARGAADNGDREALGAALDTIDAANDELSRAEHTLRLMMQTIAQGEGRSEI